jgi:hypothetical protein
MADKSCIYFLFFITILLSYFLYEESEENSRLYKICIDQEKVISDQGRAMHLQNLYLSQLKYYSEGSPGSNFSPIH